MLAWQNDQSKKKEDILEALMELKEEYACEGCRNAGPGATAAQSRCTPHEDEVEDTFGGAAAFGVRARPVIGGRVRVLVVAADKVVGKQNSKILGTRWTRADEERLAVERTKLRRLWDELRLQ